MRTILSAYWKPLPWVPSHDWAPFVCRTETYARNLYATQERQHVLSTPALTRCSSFHNYPSRKHRLRTLILPCQGPLPLHVIHPPLRTPYRPLSSDYNVPYLLGLQVTPGDRCQTTETGPSSVISPLLLATGTAPSSDMQGFHGENY